MKQIVTPHAGVWIETKGANDVYTGVDVTPHAGVWIETYFVTQRRSRQKSLPMRECGLKLDTVRSRNRSKTSLPMRECGLKRYDMYEKKLKPESLPMRECGLKLSESVHCTTLFDVTPHAGVWIETFIRLPSLKYNSHSPCGSVDWNKYTIAANSTTNSHSPCGSVDWNSSSVSYVRILVSLPMRECGLKLFVCTNIKFVIWVTPHAGVWIETPLHSEDTHDRLSLPMRECGLIQKLLCQQAGRNIVTPHAGVWIETADFRNQRFGILSFLLWNRWLKLLKVYENWCTHHSIRRYASPSPN